MRFYTKIPQLLTILAQFVQASVDEMALIKVNWYDEDPFYMKFEGPHKPADLQNPCRKGENLNLS